MNAKEALELVEKWMLFYYYDKETDEIERSQEAAEAIAVLTAMAGENEKAKAEVEEHENARSLLTELCQREKTRAETAEAELEKLQNKILESARLAAEDRRTVRCENVENERLRIMFESTEKARFELRTKLDKAEVENERLKAELVGYKTRVAIDAETIKLNFETIGKSEAELAHAKEVAEGAGYRLQNAEAKLAKWEPLIGAVGGPVEGVIEWDRNHTTRTAGNILRAALKCREGKP